MLLGEVGVNYISGSSGSKGKGKGKGVPVHVRKVYRKVE